MMIINKNINISLILLLLLMACGQRNGKDSDRILDNERGLSESYPEKDNICYAYLNEKDTVRLQIDQKADGKIRGRLTYKLYEKDINSGSFEGKMLGDTLFAEYRFASEGKISKREVAFLFKDNLVLEGYGPMTQDGDIFRFESPERLAFGQGIQLLRINCDGGN
ncbi:hypothetical protein FKX85_19005 [Echinicola soli]|uniref:Lipoprotein n=1 Tax=Echinicola soli TaxID=2591634 RepID=A0A514CMG7_9BACT|nr:hypothetical protein [Echinicola soli]QDH81019.1 hypothetical protein FKX85_19005 [Echinicola soli]